LASLGGQAQTAVLVIGLPDLPFHLRLDNLSAIFALLLGFTSVGISIYAAGYSGRAKAPRPAYSASSTTFSLPAC
jgi:hydrogenase-4 component B